MQDTFWLENSEKMVDNNCALLRELLRMAESGRDPTTLAVACFDIGQFVTYYPHGEGNSRGGEGGGMAVVSPGRYELHAREILLFWRTVLSVRFCRRMMQVPFPRKTLARHIIPSCALTHYASMAALPMQARAS